MSPFSDRQTDMLYIHVDKADHCIPSIIHGLVTLFSHHVLFHEAVTSAITTPTLVTTVTSLVPLACLFLIFLYRPTLG